MLQRPFPRDFVSPPVLLVYSFLPPHLAQIWQKSLHPPCPLWRSLDAAPWQARCMSRSSSSASRTPPLLSGKDGEGDVQLTPTGTSLVERLREPVAPSLIRPQAWCRGGLDCPVCMVWFEAEAVVNQLPCGYLFPPPWTWSFLDRVICRFELLILEFCVQIYSLEVLCLLADFLLGARLHPTATTYLCVQLFKVSTATPLFFDMKSSPMDIWTGCKCCHGALCSFCKSQAVVFFLMAIWIYFSRLT